MATPGRTLDVVWDYFSRDTHSAKYVKAVCKGCGESMAGLVERMEKHVNKCEKAQALFKHSPVPVAASRVLNGKKSLRKKQKKPC